MKETIKNWGRLVIVAILAIGLIYGINGVIISLIDLGQLHLGDFQYVDWLAISYSTIFLSTSLLGMLSDKGATVYWENVNEYTLVNPNWFNFYTLSTIGFVTLIMETYAAINQKPILVLVCFSVGIIAIITIFYKMMGSNYGREHLKRKLENQFLKKRKKCIDENEWKNYRDNIFSKLYKTTELACEEGKLDIIDENIEIFFKIIDIDSANNSIVMENLYEKIEKFVLIINQYDFIERILLFLWNEKSKLDNIDENQFVFAKICAKNNSTRKAWDIYKDDYFWCAFDKKIDKTIEKAYEEYKNLCKSEDVDLFLSGQFFQQYRSLMLEISYLLCINCESEKDMTKFLIHRLGEKLTSYEKVTVNMGTSEPEINSNGTISVINEYMFSICFMIGNQKLMQEGSEVFLASLLNIVGKTHYVNYQDDENKAEWKFILDYQMENKIFNALFEYVSSKNKKDRITEEQCLELLNAICLQRSSNVKEIKDKVKCILKLYSENGFKRYKVQFIEELYDFLEYWEGDLSDELQNVYLEEETRNELESEKIGMFVLIDEICENLKDDEVVNKFKKLKS